VNTKYEIKSDEGTTHIEVPSGFRIKIIVEAMPDEDDDWGEELDLLEEVTALDEAIHAKYVAACTHIAGSKGACGTITCAGCPGYSGKGKGPSKCTWNTPEVALVEARKWLKENGESE